MKKLLLVLINMLFVILCSAQTAEENLGKKGNYQGEPINFHKKHTFFQKRICDMDANHSGVSMQGLDLLGPNLYQFYDKGKALMIYNKKTHKLLKTLPAFTYPGADETHFGSIAFSNQTTYKNKEGKTITTKLPLVYATGHMKPKNTKADVDDKANYEFVDVVDIENDYLVKRLKIRNRYDDVICAWDFENERGWVIGYTKEGYATDNYVITSFKMNDIDEEGYLRETNPVELPGDGTLQDCVYRNGHIYILVGWGTNAKRSTLGKIHDFSLAANKITATITTDITDECEGLALDAKNKCFIVTSRCIYGENKGVGSWWNITTK